MRIETALEIVRAKDRPVIVIPKGPPETATLWNVEPGAFIQEAVYFAYSAGLVKIGYTIRPRARLADLIPTAPLSVTMILIVPGTTADEKKFHHRFAEDRVHHEWFRLSKRMRDFLKARLCLIGRASLRSAEEEFRAYCKGTS